jgi:hypothetical protein
VNDDAKLSTYAKDTLSLRASLKRTRVPMIGPRELVHSG